MVSVRPLLAVFLPRRQCAPAGRVEALAGADDFQADIVAVQALDLAPALAGTAPSRTTLRLAADASFSLEKANRVRYSTPISAQDFTVLRTASTPRLWPLATRQKRFFAQRPLPSMMMAMARHRGDVGNGLRGAEKQGGIPGKRRKAAAQNAAPPHWAEGSDGHQFLSFSARALSTSTMYLSVSFWMSSRRGALRPR